MGFAWRGQRVQVSSELLADAVAVDLQPALDVAMHELELDWTFGPRYGPPRPMPEPECCETCGRPLDDWWDD